MNDNHSDNEQQPEADSGASSPKDPTRRKRRRSRGFRRERPEGSSPRGTDNQGESFASAEHFAGASGLDESDVDVPLKRMSPEEERRYQLNYAKIIGEQVIRGSGLERDIYVDERKSQAEFGRLMMAQAGEMSGKRNRKPGGPGGR